MIPAIIALILVLDQLSKFAASKFLILNHPACVIKGVFYLTLVHNRGAAFGILQNQVLLFVIASLFAVVLIYLNFKKNSERGSSNIFLGLILAGALGNLIDRVAWGYVIDFLDFRVWPVFNIADSAITVGALLLAWQVFTDKR